MSEHVRIDANHISSDYLKQSYDADFVVTDLFCSVYQNIYQHISVETD